MDDFFNMSGISDQIEADNLNDSLNFEGEPKDVLEVLEDNESATLPEQQDIDDLKNCEIKLNLEVNEKSK